MKKILIINGEPFQDQTATGITLKNIFDRFPRENVKYIHVSKLLPDLDYLDNVFSYYKDSVERKKEHQAFASLQSLHDQNKIKAAIKNELRVWDDLRKAKISKGLVNFIIESESEIIYTCLGNLKVISLVLYARELLKCTVVPHFLDDWKSVIFSKKRYFIHKLLLQRRLKSLFKNVDVGIAISEEMAKQYKQEFNCPFNVIMNCVPDEQILDSYKSPNTRVKKFVFAGGLHLDRWKSLYNLAEAFDIISSRYEFIIEIYCPERDKNKFCGYFKKFNFVHFMGHLPVAEIDRVMKSADILIHCESFDSSIRKYTRLSVSTKIPTYLKTGKLILAFGPEEIESIQYIKLNQAGIAISVQDPEALSQILLTDIFNSNVSELLVKNATALVRRNHSCSSVERKLTEIFT